MTGAVAAVKPTPSGMCPAAGGDPSAGFRSCGIPLAKRLEPLEHVLERAFRDELVGQLVPARSHLAAYEAAGGIASNRS